VDDGDDDEGIGTEEGRRAILAVLGQEKRDAFLAALYILRSDVTLAVRQVRSDQGSQGTERTPWRMPRWRRGGGVPVCICVCGWVHLNSLHVFALSLPVCD
jgi:hypothetical protein